MYPTAFFVVVVAVALFGVGFAFTFTDAPSPAGFFLQVTALGAASVATFVFGLFQRPFRPGFFFPPKRSLAVLVSLPFAVAFSFFIVAGAHAFGIADQTVFEGFASPEFHKTSSAIVSFVLTLTFFIFGMLVQHVFFGAPRTRSTRVHK